MCTKIFSEGSRCPYRSSIMISTLFEIYLWLISWMITNTAIHCVARSTEDALSTKHFSSSMGAITSGASNVTCVSIQSWAQVYFVTMHRVWMWFRFNISVDYGGCYKGWKQVFNVHTHYTLQAFYHANSNHHNRFRREKDNERNIPCSAAQYPSTRYTPFIGLMLNSLHTMVYP